VDPLVESQTVAEQRKPNRAMLEGSGTAGPKNAKCDTPSAEGVFEAKLVEEATLPIRTKSPPGVNVAGPAENR